MTSASARNASNRVQYGGVGAITLAGIPGPPMRDTIGARGGGVDDLRRRKATEKPEPFGRARDSGTRRRPSPTSCDCPSNVRRGTASHAIGLGAWAGNGRTAVIAAAPASTNPPNRFITARIPVFGICTYTERPAAGFVARSDETSGARTADS